MASLFSTVIKKQYRYLSKDLDNLNTLNLEPFDTNIEFSFSVPEFNKSVYYCYRIKGQNELWSEYSPENKILIYGLQPGKYTLEVKASTDLSDENASFYSLPLIMKQVWYKKELGDRIIYFICSCFNHRIYKIPVYSKTTPSKRTEQAPHKDQQRLT